MKNIHILPTEEESRLQVNKHKKMFLSQEPKAYLACINQNIYITSDEEIKDGEYGICLNLVREGFKSHQAVFKMDAEQRQAMEELGGQKKAEVLKIILTTDQDLIKDGVQAIDDTFLEWFVKNPSCEEVKIHTLLHKNYFGFDKDLRIYKIVIPKGEPKLTNVCIKCGVDLYYADKFACQEHPKNCKGIHLSEETLKERALKEETKQDEIMERFISNAKQQETLEEAAERFVEAKQFRTEEKDKSRRYCFIQGAKWQQERSYSEEEVKNIIKVSLIGVGLKYHKENTIEEFFKQFKKK
jgi:hypothetical protein